MLKKIIMGLLMVSSLFGQDAVMNFLKYSTAYASFSLNAPRYIDDKFAVIDGLTTGAIEIETISNQPPADFQTSFGLRKIGRFQYEPKRGIKGAGKGGDWYDGSEQNANETATVGPVKGFEYLIKWAKGRQWGDEYVNEEYWLRYTGDWIMAKVGWTELGLEKINYVQGDLRLKWTPEMLGSKLTVSIGAKHRQHPVYGFDAMVLDTSWYSGQWWKFAETAFNVDDNQWVDEEYFDDEGNIIWGDLGADENGSTLLEFRNGEWVPLDPDDGGGPFWNGRGEYWGYDWLWRDADGNLFAYTDREYFIYHFPNLLDGYIKDMKKSFGWQRETSLVIGMDFYHHEQSWWLHAWGNCMPVHYGHDKYSYHNVADYADHLEDKKEPKDFRFMDPMVMEWNDYDFGMILGVKIQDNLGIFTEGKYLYYWDRPAYDFKFGMNYQFMGF